MRSTRRIESSLAEEFPEELPAITSLRQTDEDFRELCDHYHACLTVLSDLFTAESPDPRRVREYEELTLELAHEIRETVRTFIRKQST